MTAHEMKSQDHHWTDILLNYNYIMKEKISYHIVTINLYIAYRNG